ncbi:hypothetical protein H1V43_05515 [Streptomyces sp. PSKA54]|uniref:Uncharacterized protein n=1 Tax=Streptomyces himalayensis subsp. aureolus TaxID=2758039 RepID=A0A7W2CXT3_9ACTN|nr:hypothetical protein [Streptomyces himalayensis]MBA4860845.1 hypothetical protein [Streptomyces himalayensis subsp. aureolus]
MDLESIEAELYGLAPEDFIPARDRYAAAARKENDRTLAAKISALRRPTLAAWAGNLLVRAEPEQVAGLLRLGEGLRQAHEQLDGPQLRDLNRQQHGVVGALARQARLLAAEAGHPVGDDMQREIEDTLHAVLADPEAAQQWASGRLTKALHPPVGTQFFAGAESAAAATAPPARGKRPVPEPATTARRAPARDSAVPTAKEAKERRRQEELRQKLAHARQEAESTEQQALLREDELRQAEARREQAERLLQEADARVAALAEELKAAQERQRTARSDLDAARHQATEAGRTAQKARRAAQNARTRAERLETG